MPIRYQTRQVIGPDGKPLFDEDGKPVMETTTTFIPGSTASKAARDFWARHEKAFGELQRRKAERRRDLAEREFWKKYGIVGVHR